jgi:hypothetical protein
MGPALSALAMEAIMTEKTLKELHTDWIATKDVVGFQQLLNEETDEGRYSILSELLAQEFGRFRKPQAKSPGEPDSVVIDVGNPLMGFLLGALVIAGTMGSLFLWESYQGSADASAAVVTVQNR